jgi:hypothetical protein
MKKKSYEKRLGAIDRQRLRNQKRAEKHALFNYGVIVLLAYHLGDLQRDKSLLDAYGRALNYKNMEGICGAIASALRRESLAQFQFRRNRALRALSQRFHFDMFPQEKLEQGIIKLAKRLPREWIDWINKQVALVNYAKERHEEEHINRIFAPYGEERTPREFA